jgi:NAD(P)-dependent dehydrogenase (short-subunit alcohol dehydrogenase family)
MQLDLSSLQSVRQFGAAWRRRGLPLHALVNNAGIFAMAAAREQTPEGFEAHLGTNHLGHFLLTMLLLPSLRRTAEQASAALLPSGQPAARHWCTHHITSPTTILQGARPLLANHCRLPAAASSCPFLSVAHPRAMASPFCLALQTGRPSRVVHVSSKIHFMGQLHQQDMNLAAAGVYNSLAAYGQSKLAQVGGWVGAPGPAIGPSCCHPSG